MMFHWITLLCICMINVLPVFSDERGDDDCKFLDNTDFTDLSKILFFQMRF